MVKIYADLVEAGLRAIEDGQGVIKVPDKYLEDVIKELQARGYLK